MTKRQLKWHKRISPFIPQIAADAQRELADRPVGSECSMRLYTHFGLPQTHIRVIKLPDGLHYREDLPTYRKGISPPIFRPLPT